MVKKQPASEEEKVEETEVETKGEPVEEDDDNDADILALKGQVEKKIQSKASTEEKKWSDKDVDNIVKRLGKQFSDSRETEDEDYIDLLDPNAVKRKFVRLARLNNKFVVGLKDMNTDTYTDEPLFYVNIENPKKAGDMIPWSTFLYDDGTEELYPYLSFMNRSVGVWAEVIREDKVDISEKFGVIEVKEVDAEDEWNMKKTGKKVLAKAQKYRITYIVKDTKGGKEMAVSQEVINKVEAPYADLRKFIGDNK